MQKMKAGGRRTSTCGSEKIGEKLKYFRHQRGLSQTELAEGICSPSLISQLENGRGTTVEMLVKLADKLQIPLRELYSDVEGDFPELVKLDLAEAYILRGELEPAQDMLNFLSNQDNLTLVENQRRSLLQGMLWNKNDRSIDTIQLLQPLVDEFERDKNADDELICKFYNQIGNAYYHIRNFTKAYSAYKRAYQVSLRFPVFEMTAAIAAYNLGMICNELGNGEEASIYLDAARNYFESISDIVKMAHSYFYSAIATKNETYVTQALQLYQNLNALQMVRVVKQYHAFHIEAKKDYRKAVKELITIAEEMSAIEDANCIFTLARAVTLCLNNSDLEQARSTFELASTYKDKMQNATPYNLALFYQAKARLSLNLNELDSCISNAQKSSEMYEDMGMFIDSADSLELAVNGYQRKNMHDVACEISMKVNSLLRQSRG